MGRRCLGRQAAAAREVVQLSTRADLILPQAKLRNRTNLCYCNALLQCVYWLGEVSTMAQACYGNLQAGLRVLKTAGELTLPHCIDVAVPLSGGGRTCTSSTTQESSCRGYLLLPSLGLARAAGKRA